MVKKSRGVGRRIRDVGRPGPWFGGFVMTDPAGKQWVRKFVDNTMIVYGDGTIGPPPDGSGLMGGRWEPLSDGAMPAPELVFNSDGDVVMAWVT